MRRRSFLLRPTGPGASEGQGAGDREQGSWWGSEVHDAAWVGNATAANILLADQSGKPRPLSSGLDWDSIAFIHRLASKRRVAAEATPGPLWMDMLWFMETSTGFPERPDENRKPSEVAVCLGDFGGMSSIVRYSSEYQWRSERAGSAFQRLALNVNHG